VQRRWADTSMCCTDAAGDHHVWTYSTEANGDPAANPRQKLLIPRLTQLEVDPNGLYAYGLVSWRQQDGSMRSDIRLFYIEANGELRESSHLEARYGPDFYYSAQLYGFNSTGSKLYDVWSFSFDHELAWNYSYHPVQSATGTLKPDVPVFNATGFDSLDAVSFSDELVAETVDGEFYSYVNIYKNPPAYVNGQFVPLIHCDQAMLEGCFNSQNAILDREGRNVFLIPLLGGDATVARIDLSGKQLVGTGSIPNVNQITLSPNPRLVYAANWPFSGNAIVTAYLIDPETGEVMQGGQIVTKAQALYAAQRRR